MKFIYRVCSKDEDYYGGASNGDATFFHQAYLGFEFDFGLIGLEFSLVEIWGIVELLHTLLEVCPAHKDKVEIKCIGSAGGKTPTEPKLYLFFSNFWCIEYDKVDVMCFISLVTTSEN